LKTYAFKIMNRRGQVKSKPNLFLMEDFVLLEQANLIIVILSGKFPNNGSTSLCTVENKLCAYCGKMFSGEGWPHVEGDSKRGVLKIEQFCSEEHKYNFLSSEL
jgi:hypothetical protein